MSKDAAEKCRESDLKALKSQGPYKMEEKIGDSYFDVVKQRIIDEKGNIIGIASVIRDITERKQAEEEIKKSLELAQTAMKKIIQAMSFTIESKDPYTAGHQLRVSRLAVAIAKEMGLENSILETLSMVSLIHDIGKITIPTEILSKPGKLTKQEFELIKIHPVTGFEILDKIELHWPLAKIIAQHHERINGSGYPCNLRGEDILLEAKIIAIADVVEAMASHRPYRPALGIDAALSEIEKNKGILYDNRIADACIKILKENRFKLD